MVIDVECYCVYESGLYPCCRCTLLWVLGVGTVYHLNNEVFDLYPWQKEMLK